MSGRSVRTRRARSCMTTCKTNPETRHPNVSSRTETRRCFQKRCASSLTPNEALDLVDLLNAASVAPAFERRREPRVHDRYRVLARHHAFTDRDHVRVVMQTAQPGGFDVPAQRAAHTLHSVRDDRFSISRAAE